MDIIPPATPAEDPNAPMTPEHKAELQKVLDLVKQGYGKWNSVKFSLNNRAESAKNDELKRVFQMFASMGVNLKDPKSVQDYLAQLQKESPETYDIVCKALDYLLGTDYENNDQPQDPGAVPQGAPEAAPTPEGV